MTDQIKFRIAIEGGDEVKSQIQKIFDQIKKQSGGKIDIGIDEKSIGRMKAALQGISNMWRGMAGPLSSTGRELTRVREATIGVGLAMQNSVGHARRMLMSFSLLTAGIGALIHGATRLSDVYQQQAAASGLTVEEFAKFRYAIGQNEAPMQTAAIMMSYFNKKVAQAAEGAGKGAEIFKELGISVRDATGDMKPTMDLFFETMDRMKEMYEGAAGAITVIKTAGDTAEGASGGFQKLNASLQKTEYLAKDTGAATRELTTGLGAVGDKAQFVKKAMDIFGRGGGLMVKSMRQGSEEFKRLFEEAEKLGIVLSTKDTEAMDNFRDNVQSLELTIFNFINRGLARIAPTFEKMADSVRTYLQENRTAIDDFVAGTMDAFLNVLPDIIKAIKDLGTTIYGMGSTLKWIAGLFEPLLEMFNSLTGLNLSGWGAAASLAFLYVTRALGLLKAAVVAVVANLRFLLLTPFGRLLVLGVTISSLIRSLSQGWDAFKQKVVNAVQAALSALKGFWNGLVSRIPALKQFDAAVQSAFQYLSDNAGDAVERVKEALLRLHEGLDYLVQKFNEMTGLDLSTGFVEMGAAILLLLNPIGTVKIAVRSLMATIGVFVGALGSWPLMIAAALGGAWLAFEEFPDLGPKIIEWLQSAKDYIEANAGIIADAVVNTISKAGEALAQLIPVIADSLENLLTMAIEDLSSADSKLLSVLGKLTVVVLEAMAILATLLLVAIGETVLTGLVELGKAIVSGIAWLFTDLIPFLVVSVGVWAGLILAGLAFVIAEGLKAIYDGVMWVLDQILGLFGTSTTEIGEMFSRMWNAIWEKAAWLWGQLKRFGNWLLSFFTKVDETADKIENAADKARDAQNIQPSNDSGQEYAGGGYVSGPGTATSDSIAAWLSNGEFVVKARAVAKYGLGFLHQINAMRFADGGLVTAGVSMPSISLPSSGGSGIRSQRTLNLYIDGQEFKGMTAPDNVADDLEKYAAKKRMVSAGKRPTWVGR